MKNTLITLTFASLTLLFGAGASAQLSTPGPTTTASMTTVQAAPMTVASEPRTAPQAQLHLAIIGTESRPARGFAPPPANLPAASERSEGIPSTASGLAALLLMICILIGRRNKHLDA